MTKAYDLPKIALDIKGDRLRFLMAECIEECELQYRRGKFDKAESLMNFITAAAGPLSVLGVVGSVVVGNVTADNIVTAAEAASPVTATVTYTNVSNGRTAIVLLDGVTNAGVTISAASANAATITLTSAVATALSIGSHTLTVIVIDDAGVGRTVIKGFSRSAQSILATDGLLRNKFMRIDDICSPGLVPNSHRLRQETIRAIAFCENLKSSEKAVELIGYFREAIAYLDREIVSKDLPESEKPIVDENAISPFDEEEIAPPEQPKEKFVPINKRGKK